MRFWHTFLLVLVVVQVLPIAMITSSAYGDEDWNKGVASPFKKGPSDLQIHTPQIGKAQNMPIYRLHGGFGSSNGGKNELAKVSRHGFSMIGSFNGLSYDNVTPPDVQIAAGPQNIMEMVNLEGQVWAKNGIPEGPPFALSSFYGTGDGFISDPKVLYDEASGRWFSSLMDLSTSTVFVAVSNNSDAASKFCVYNFTSYNYLIPDQPILGVSRDKIGIAVNDFDPYSGQFVFSQIWVINKDQMLSCSPIDFVSKTLPQFFSIHPAQSTGKESTLYMVSTSQNGTAPAIDVFSVKGIPPGPVTIEVSAVNTISMDQPPSAPQPGTNLKIDTGDARIQDAKVSGGNLWLSFNDGCVPPGDSVLRSCLHFVKIDTSNMRVGQDFDYGLDGKYLFYPAIAEMPESHSLFVAYGYSSATDYPGIQTTMQFAKDEKNTLASPLVMKEGLGAINLIYGCELNRVCRYGDYFGAAVDPSAHNVVWAAGEYGSGIQDSEGFGAGWGTEIANFTADNMHYPRR